MKFIWEEDDVEPGRRVQNSSGNGEMIIGYRYDDSHHRQPAIITVVSLDDGLEVVACTTKVVAEGDGRDLEDIIATGRAQIADWLNQSKATPKTIGLR